VRRQTLEQIHCLIKVINHLLLGHIIRITLRLKRTYARAVLVPLVLPQALVGPLVREPVPVHELDELRLALRLEYGADVVVLGDEVAELVVSAIAKVGPTSTRRGVEVVSKREANIGYASDRQTHHSP